MTSKLASAQQSVAAANDVRRYAITVFYLQAAFDRLAIDGPATDTTNARFLAPDESTIAYIRLALKLATADLASAKDISKRVRPPLTT